MKMVQMVLGRTFVVAPLWRVAHLIAEIQYTGYNAWSRLSDLHFISSSSFPQGLVWTLPFSFCKLPFPSLDVFLRSHL